jgi:hypothetical protein
MYTQEQIVYIYIYAVIYIYINMCVFIYYVVSFRTSNKYFIFSKYIKIIYLLF